MRCGLLSVIRAKNIGFGSLCISILVRLSGFIWETVLSSGQGSCGHLCLRVYRQCAGAYTDFWQAYAIVFAILSVSTVLCAREFLVWSEKLYLSLKREKTTLELSGFLFITTMHPYPFRTTILSS